MLTHDGFLVALSKVDKVLQPRVKLFHNILEKALEVNTWH